MALDPEPAFAIWLTGLPSSGKSTIAARLTDALAERGVKAVVLESDALRTILTPNPRYDEQERDLFYQQMADLGALFAESGVPVIFDATAQRRAYRDRARARVPRFAEIYVACPLEICMARDPKGIYERALHNPGGQPRAGTVPGLQSEYEPPADPELTIHADTETPETAVERIVARLIELGFC
ncbi:MAG TPA: adenylyl-sulfate kinase [Bryobacteraceae bacterium]|nr:adenylyl-sulfate kinase [Bryobacteraceae bacterium]